MAYNARRPYAVLGLLAAGLLASTSAVSAATVTYDRLVHPEDANWLTNNRTYDGHRFSPLDQVNTSNVGDLHMAFAVPLIPTIPAGLGGGLQGTPLVNDGTMYMVDGAGAVYSIDVSSGRQGYINWIMNPDTDPEIPGIVNNRGVALLGDNVYSVTRDGYLTATDAGTGEMLWQVATQIDPDEYFTMAPLAIDGKIIMGPAGDAPMRGWLDARSADDGSQLWHWWAIPGPGEPGHETWPNTDIYLEGGSSFWVTGTYDPDTNLLYYGVSNPTPFGDPTLRPGDNLYSQSTVALDGNTGQLQWYFQYTPNDQWDYDEIGTQMLVNADGQQRILHFGRNGFLYTLDATNGDFLTANQYVNVVNWTAGIDDKTGKPIEYNPDLGNTAPQTYAIAPFGGDVTAPVICPNIQGGVNFQPTAFSPLTNYTYGSALEACSETGAGFGLSDQATGTMVAGAPDGTVAVRSDIPFAPYGGTLATGGHLVFSSMVNGDFFAADDQTLQTLWSVNLGSPIEAPPMTYAVNGQQYVVIPVGTSNINSLFPNGGYLTRGDDPNAAALINEQRTWTLYFFAL